MADFDFSAVGIASGRRRLAGFISGPTRRPTPSTLPARRPMPSIPGRRRSGPRLVLGAHQSIAGGFHRAVERAIETGCECLQIFTRNINQWAVSPIAADDASKFQEAVRSAGLALVVAHDSYLINPASADPDLRKKSIAGLIEEVRRAEMLGIPWVVAHPGAAGEQPVTAAVARAAAGIAEALRKTPKLAAGILIETTAGQGSCLGATFEEIGAMLDVIDSTPSLKKRIGVCLDTCHVFAAGYPLAPAAALDDTLRQFDRHIGLKRLKVIHANDSKRELGSRVDRHEGIGTGKIGREAFRLLANHPALTGIPWILETPKEGPDGKPSAAVDRRNIATIRRLERS